MSKYKFYINSTQRNQKTLILLSDKDEIVEKIEGDFDIVSKIQILLKNNNINPLKDIIEFVPDVGPGSFTGIKVGITIANVANWVLGNNKSFNPEYGAEPNINVKTS